MHSGLLNITLEISKPITKSIHLYGEGEIPMVQITHPPNDSNKMSKPPTIDFGFIPIGTIIPFIL